jgi:hypothetical protein
MGSEPPSNKRVAQHTRVFCGEQAKALYLREIASSQHHHTRMSQPNRPEAPIAVSYFLAAPPIFPNSPPQPNASCRKQQRSQPFHHPIYKRVSHAKGD